MADIRIKDLATTATTTASDDFMAVDGATNGTRKLSAATPSFLTSVTTPSLTSPASTPLTLGTGTFGTALTVASATGNVGIGTTTTDYKITLGVAGTETQSIFGLTTVVNTAAALAKTRFGLAYTGNPWAFMEARMTWDGASLSNGELGFYTSLGGVGAGLERMVIKGNGNVTIASTTAGSSGAGALVVTGGLATGAASYIGGALTVTGTISGAGTNTWALQSVGASGALVAGGWLYGINNGFNITPNGAGVAGATLMLAAFDGTGYREMLSTANVASGASTLRLAGYGGPTTVGGTLSVTGAATFAGTVSPQQATTAAAPAYVKGAIYFDITLNKLRVGGATAWETITSV